MPPKKQVAEKKILLGRPGNNLKSGIVCMTFPAQALAVYGLTDDISIGRTCQRREIYALPGHHQMLPG